jgi:hypothetical protein
MAIEKTIIKRTHNAAVVKVVCNSTSGGTITVTLSGDLKLAQETFVPASADVHITQAYWAIKNGKDAVVQRVAADASLHGDYYLSNTGHFKFLGFRDSTESGGDIKVTFSGEGMVMLTLSKESGFAI